MNSEAHAPPSALERLGIGVLLEDDSLLVLNKPPNLHSARVPNSEAPSVADALLEMNPATLRFERGDFDGGLINRLDFETSGILLAAKSQEDLQSLRDAQQDGAIKKEYLALVEGEFVRRETIESYIGSPHRGAHKMRSYPRQPRHARALPGRTEIEPVNYFEEHDLTLVRCETAPARRHQVRLHLAVAGHPIAGDKLYRAKTTLGNHFTLGCDRDFILHAYTAALKHPRTESTLEFRAPLSGMLTQSWLGEYLATRFNL